MKRSPRGWIALGVIVLAVVCISATVASMWINAVIHTSGFRHEVETRASRTLHAPVEIKEIDFSLWKGVKLEGLATKLETPQGTVAAQVESVSCSYSLLALLERRLQLNGVTLEKPEIVLTQQPPSTVPTPPAPNTAASAEAAKKEVPTSSASPFQFVLESLKISDGHLSIRDATGASKADLQGLEVTANTSGFYAGKEVTGKLKIATIQLPQNLALTDFSTPFSYQPNTVNVSSFTAKAFDGHLTGQYHLVPGSPSLLEVNAEKIDVGKASASASPNAPHRLSGYLALQSKWNGAETGKLTGEGDAQITGGKLEGVRALRDLATVFQVRGLSDPELKTVTTHFQVAEGATHFSNLVIESDDFALTGNGLIGAQGGLDANLVLTLHGRAMGGVSGFAASLISAGGSIPLHLSGTVSDPKTNLNPHLGIPGVNVQKPLKSAFKHLFH